MKEREIEYSILDWLNFNGVFAWKVNVKGYFDQNKGFYRRSNNVFDLRGQPDITGVLPDGRALFVEVKTDRGKLSDDQVWFGQKLQESGCVYIVARSIEDVEQKIKNEGYILT